MNKKQKVVKAMVAIAVAFCFMGLAMPSDATDTDTVVITTTPEGTLSVSVDKETWANGNLAYGADNNTGLLGWGTITNDGSIACKVNIKSSDTTAWTVEPSVGYNQFAANITINEVWEDGDDVQISDAYQQLIASLSAEGGSNTQTFDVGLTMPTGGSTTLEQTITLTFQAVAV